MTRPKTTFEIKDENEMVAEVSGIFWLLRENHEDFQKEFDELVEKYAI